MRSLITRRVNQACSLSATELRERHQEIIGEGGGGGGGGGGLKWRGERKGRVLLGIGGDVNDRDRTGETGRQKFGRT